MLGKIADSSFITFLLLISLPFQLLSLPLCSSIFSICNPWLPQPSPSRLHEAPSVARATGKSLLNEDAIAAYEALIDSTLAGGRA